MTVRRRTLRMTTASMRCAVRIYYASWPSLLNPMDIAGQRT